ncbi:lycopene cyclase family protein [Streptomyces tsukubensis]|uniref:Lycopene cyclase n=1 Tax=Streptomyces tsukubensis TaxID=83656 RepID=A0A1V3ZZD5_9ACTN|nr:lycopene cyclase family protein [Streptomyces tsukubensis]OON71865.1 lycopene cyclase [Streptomyces tsukubensis]QFR91814.1 lycopene cyclase [Streptomyces tsukubensis]
MHDTDITIVGAGAAGLSLAHRLRSRPGAAALPRVTLVEAPEGGLRPPERTWCFWERPGGEYDGALTASWGSLRVRGPDGSEVVGRPDPFRYKMLRSGAFEALLSRGAGAPHRVEAVVDGVRDIPGGAEVTGTYEDGRALALRSRWVFDSRPPPVLPPARTTLLQHFKGWFVRCEQPVFDPAAADLMDFRTPQPPHGLSFGYVLPTGPREALVEYTEFSGAALDDAAYDRALGHYVRDVLGVGRYTVADTEHGVIPMTDGSFPRRTGASVFRIGAGGGATRPSTGYTFAAIQRQTRAIASAHAAGRVPVPPASHSRRARAMDAVLLRGLDSGRVDGAEFFTRLFQRVPMERLLRFLDGQTGMGEDLRIGLHTPVSAMLRTAAELPLLPRRRPRAR